MTESDDRINHDDTDKATREGMRTNWWVNCDHCKKGKTILDLSTISCSTYQVEDVIIGGLKEYG